MRTDETRADEARADGARAAGAGATGEGVPVVRLEEVDPGVRPERPVARIAVLVSLNFPDLTEPVADLVRTFTSTALATLVGLEATFELFDTSTALADPSTVAELDGLLVLGGGDVDGSLYGCYDTSIPNSYGVDLRADRDTIAALEVVVAAGRPVLAICRGAQLVNVAGGGTVIPDIEDYRLHRGGPGEPMFVDEQVTIVDGTRLASLVANHRLTVRSGHHQAIDRVADGFVVSALADDGIIEGIEHRERWILALQWHPEDPAGPDHDRLGIFEAFVEAAAKGLAAWPRS
ncbi:gamma-glutamyl-gamma-aminobutyrate hydrolase family protein [Intrasporangium oryzae]|uniref:gamma-glutamyl-gamma-aminobutyrate hydrolase family protein n=1 Tax=Intrasporangium oryzae TaxID=412687 RepID=UPI001FE1BDAC|nr:gamma-glutamyl-gamma-aminobutyrate hydrolase family protein [Intrasporangium oryzae]